MDGVLYKAANASALLPTGRLDRPKALTPVLAVQAPGALGDAAIDDAKTQGALGHIIGRLDDRMRDKSKVFMPMEPKAVGQLSGDAPGLGSSRFFQEAQIDVERSRAAVARVDG